MNSRKAFLCQSCGLRFISSMAERLEVCPCGNGSMKQISVREYIRMNREEKSCKRKSSKIGRDGCRNKQQARTQKKNSTIFESVGNTYEYESKD